MDMLWIYNLPNWLLCLLIWLVFTGGSLVGQVITRPLVRRFATQALADHNNAVGTVIGAYGVFYGITLGLIAVATWDGYEVAEHLVIKEASSLAALDRDVSALPEPAASELRHLLRNYLDYVIDRAWPEHRRGIIPVEGETLVDAFASRLVRYDPKTERDSALFQAAITQFNDMLEHRGERLASIGNGLPTVLWWIVLIGAILNMAILYVLRIEPLRTHTLLIALLSSFISLMIFVIIAMDHPFVGDLSINPTPFENLRARQMAVTH